MMKREKLFILIFLGFFIMMSEAAFSDQIRLKPREEGNEGEILEETNHYFIIKFPKEEVELVRRKKPTEMRLWREKRILWEDLGDYITIHLPKERMVATGETSGEERPVRFLTEGLQLTGKSLAERPSGYIMKDRGRVEGRIFRSGNPLSSCKVMLKYVPTSSGGMMATFQKKKKGEDVGGLFETITDTNGKYRFENILVGNYDIYWMPSGESEWIRRLSKKPSLIVSSGDTLHYEDIHVK